MPAQLTKRYAIWRYTVPQRMDSAVWLCELPTPAEAQQFIRDQPARASDRYIILEVFVNDA